ncbi:unnamed protein product [Rhizophagus irregularis]|nr:unnamed protein product [Rhizophagus irregularis]
MQDDNDEIQDDNNEMKDFNNDINSIRKTLNTVTKRQTSMFIKANKKEIMIVNIIRAKKGLKAEDNLLNIKY